MEEILALPSSLDSFSLTWQTATIIMSIKITSPNVRETLKREERMKSSCFIVLARAKPIRR